MCNSFQVIAFAFSWATLAKLTFVHLTLAHNQCQWIKLSVALRPMAPSTDVRPCGSSPRRIDAVQYIYNNVIRDAYTASKLVQRQPNQKSMCALQY